MLEHDHLSHLLRRLGNLRDTPSPLHLVHNLVHNLQLKEKRNDHTNNMADDEIRVQDS